MRGRRHDLQGAGGEAVGARRGRGGGQGRRDERVRRRGPRRRHHRGAGGRDPLAGARQGRAGAGGRRGPRGAELPGRLLPGRRRGRAARGPAGHGRRRRPAGGGHRGRRLRGDGRALPRARGAPAAPGPGAAGLARPLRPGRRRRRRAGGDPYLALVSGLGAAAASLSSAGASWSSAAAAAAAAAAAGGGGGAGGGDAGLRTAAAASLAADLLSGLAGAGDDAALFARVARVVVAGGLVPGGDALAAAAASAAAGNLCGVGGLGGVSAGGAGASSSSAAGGAGGAGGKAAPGAAAAAARAALGGPLRDADALALSLAASVPLDVMPGLPDPTGHALPQQPLHACLLPGAASRFGGGAGRKGTLVRATNPHDFDLGGVRFLGTSGQNVDDVLRWSTIGLAGADGGAEEEPSAANRASLGDGPRRCEALRSLLAWGHLAPTAPDTLAAFPFKSADPFVMEGCPHVFFCGGGREFATATAEVGDDGRVVEAGAEEERGLDGAPDLGAGLLGAAGDRTGQSEDARLPHGAGAGLKRRENEKTEERKRRGRVEGHAFFFGFNFCKRNQCWLWD